MPVTLIGFGLGGSVPHAWPDLGMVIVFSAILGWLPGIPLSMTPSGIITCTVRASADPHHQR